MKPFCYVTNMTGSQFSRQGSFKCLTQDGFTVLVENVRKLHYLFCDILPEMLENIPLQVRQQLWFQHDGAPSHFALDVREYLNNVFPNRWIGRGGPVEATTFSRSHSYGFLYLGGDEVFGVRDTDRHSGRAGCPCGTSCSNYS